MNQETLLKIEDSAEEVTDGSAMERKEATAAYCKPELKCLGVLASAAGSDPHLAGGFLPL